MSDKEQADALRAEAVVFLAEAETIDASISELKVEISEYMASTKIRLGELRAAAEEKLLAGRAAATEAERLDPHPDAQHARIGG